MPTCTCLPREKRDTESADTLSKIIPVITQRCKFEQCYADNAWEKLRFGTAIYGVFWNPHAEGGLGDVDIRPVDVSDLYWEMGVSDIQDSKNVFLVSLADKDRLESTYSISYDEYKDADSELMSLIGYKSDDEKCLVVDWYYKRYDPCGKETLHLCKFMGDVILYSSEADPDCTDGWYAHGKYPFVFDRLYPKDRGICGF
jgi:hypothetical protein